MPKHKDQIIALRAQGKSFREIREELGCSQGTIAYHVSPGHKAKAGLNRKRAKEIRKEWLRSYKEEHGCADCGEFHPYWVLQFDHVRGTKLMNMSELNTLVWKAIFEEVEKCDVVCANCHAMRTYDRMMK